MTNRVYSVGQLNKYIKDMFAQDFFLKRISIKGEVSNCKYHSSGHIYFTLKDESGTIAAIMFAGNRKNGLRFPMKDGDKVVVSGSVEVYERDGKYQMYAQKIELDGAGELYLRFEALKRELEEMGMFSEEYKQPIPRYIRRLGIVTASTGAAIQDIRNISSRRNPYVQLVLYPAQVQGEGAAMSIVQGIQALEAYGVDTIIVGRGGGSIEDLWAFNEEIVARAIFDCRVPIISAVGHETDWTIADFVSDMRAPTPSAAAELAVFDLREVLDLLQRQSLRMANFMEQRLMRERERLSYLQTRMQYQSPSYRMNENRRILIDYEEPLSRLVQQVLLSKRHQLQLLAGSLEGNSPMKKLSQGFAFVENAKHQAIHSVEGIQQGEELGIYLIDGSIKAVVSEVVKNE